MILIKLTEQEALTISICHQISLRHLMVLDPDTQLTLMTKAKMFFKWHKLDQINQDFPIILNSIKLMIIKKCKQVFQVRGEDK